MLVHISILLGYTQLSISGIPAGIQQSGCNDMSDDRRQQILHENLLQDTQLISYHKYPNSRQHYIETGVTFIRLNETSIYLF